MPPAVWSGAGAISCYLNGSQREPSHSRLPSGCRTSLAAVSLQRYVSRELSHFVGASFPDDEDRQYELLLTILRSGELRTPNQNLGSSHRFGTPLFSDDGTERYEQSVICFCDIPEADLTIHMKKYGRVGLAFAKDFLTRRGARPVYYVATTTTGLGAGEPGSPPMVRDHFNDLVARLDDLQRARLVAHSFDAPTPELSADLEQVLTGLLEQECLRFIKGFDPGAEDEDAQNVYMEREWRIAHARMAFELDDVCRVFMPARFGQQFRRDMGKYTNQVSFVEG
jgi:hypothetical protein